MIFAKDSKDAARAYERFLDVIHTLRAPGGCPWDREQTPLTMRPDLIEETFEAVDAITSNDPLHAKEELGDVMLNATMISYMYEQNEDFSVADVLNELADKLIRRHPHVFTESEGASQAQGVADNAEKVLAQWDRIKENVEGRKGSSILDEVPESFPPLLRSFKLAKKAAKKGFDWPDSQSVADKVTEEWSEVQSAIEELEYSKTDEESESAAKAHVEEELGDLLFAISNYCSHLEVNPEVALARANKKFYNRFTYVEQKMAEKGIEMKKNPSAEEFRQMDDLWNEAKKLGLN